MFVLREAKVTLNLRVNKKRKRKYRAGELIKAICVKAGVPTGALITGSAAGAYSRFIRRNRSAQNLIFEVLLNENKKSGRDFIFRFANGKFEVRPKTVNPLLYDISDELSKVSFSKHWTHDARVPYTMLEATAKIGKRKKVTRYTAKPQGPDGKNLIKFYGKVVKKKDYHAQSSIKEFRDAADRDLAKLIKPIRTASVTIIPGLPFVRRADLIKLEAEPDGYVGDGAMIAVTSVSQSLSGGVLSTSLELAQENIYEKYSKEQQEKKDREKKRTDRKKS
jgi:hypothetical protein